MKLHVKNLLRQMQRRASRHNTVAYRVVAAAIDHRGAVINMQTNCRRFHKLHGGLHAEHRLLLESPRSVRRIVIARFGKSGAILPIDPCEKCRRLAGKLGVKIESVM